MKQTNKGCKGHFWTDIQNIDDMKASDSDIIGYNNYILRMNNRGLI